MTSCVEPLSTFLKVVMTQCSKTLKRIQKLPVFGHFRKSQRVKFATKYSKSTTRLYWIWFSCNFYWKSLFFTVFSGIIHDPFVSVWYYHMPFFSNVETQVWQYKGYQQQGRAQLMECCWFSLMWSEEAQSVLAILRGVHLLKGISARGQNWGWWTVADSGWSESTGPVSNIKCGLMF